MLWVRQRHARYSMITVKPRGPHIAHMSSQNVTRRGTSCRVFTTERASASVWVPGGRHTDAGCLCESFPHLVPPPSVSILQTDVSRNHFVCRPKGKKKNQKNPIDA